MLEQTLYSMVPLFKDSNVVAVDDSSDESTDEDAISTAPSLKELHYVLSSTRGLAVFAMPCDDYDRNHMDTLACMGKLLTDVADVAMP